MSRKQLLRLGLFQVAAGGVSVLFLGVLNRIMRVEWGLDLFLVTLLLGGGHYLGALVAIPFGYYSDRHLVAGYRRTAYILGGLIITLVILVASPWIAQWLAASVTVVKGVLAFLLFFLEGIATYVAGTAYLALIADRTTDQERGQATGLIWTLLMVGIIATGVSTGFALREYSFHGLVLYFGIGAMLALILGLIALIRQEPRRAALPAPSEGSLRDALRLVVSSRSSRWFAAFLTLSMFSYFMQDVLLEPFGGEVFFLSAGETARFNAYMGVGVISGMLLGGMRLIPRWGKRTITGAGVALMAFTFLALAGSGVMGSVQGLPVIITLLGFGAGFFTVGGVALMMDMTSTQHTGLFVGAWTLVQAVARGPASMVGGALHSMASGLGLTTAQAYGAVFVFEATGLLISLVFLQRVVVAAFRQEVQSFTAIATESMDF